LLWGDDGGCVVERARSAGRVSKEVRAANGFPVMAESHCGNDGEGKANGLVRREA